MTEMTDNYMLCATGLSVFQDDAPVEGPVVWLDSPQAVIEFVSGGDVKDSIVIARGGTTTFLTPALTAGVKGIVTLQGAPESHLGILSREFGIPCVMGVGEFERGVRSSRGETIPADGALVRLEISDPQGKVLVDANAPVDEAAPAPTDEEAAAAAAAQAEQIKVLLERFLGEVPHGSAGDEIMRSRQTTGVLELTDDSIHRDLTVAEINDLQSYMSWNIWDFLALRATEGESGLIPRQEYECFGCVMQWTRYAEFCQLILDAVGVDGLVDIGATVRREPANKANLLRIWCTGFTPLFGRAVLGELGMESTDERPEDVALMLQFMRRLYKGAWGEGPMFTSNRGYTAPVLDASWIERFTADQRALTDADARRRFTNFNAGTELTGFLLHFDNRSGLHDSGPYPLPGGGFMIVRDHFLRDPLYHWHDVAADLPHCVTQAMVFAPDEPLDLALMDGATLFTKPANYLKHLTSAAVYVRQEWDTPASEIRLIDEAEMASIAAECERVTTKLYKRIASMPKRDKIVAGAQVYYAEFVAPIARAAGVWEKMRDELDFFEIDPLASEAYYPLVRDGKGVPLLGQALLTATGYAPLSEGALAEVPLEALHTLVVRGMVAELDGAEELEAAGLVVKTNAGYMPTQTARTKHTRLLAAERAGLDLDGLGGIYDRFLAVNGPFKSLNARWQSASEDERFELLGEIADVVDRVEPVLRRTAEQLPRFGGYTPRLRTALERAEEGDHEWVTSPRIDSLHTVWMEVHEDYLLTLGRSREEEGSF